MIDDGETDELFGCFIDNLDDIFYVLDADGGIVRVNEKAATVTGVSRDEISSMNALEVIAPEDRNAVEADIRRALETGRAGIEAHLLTEDGERIPYEFKKQRITDDDDDVVGVVGIGRDISERKRRERQLERQAQQYEAFGSILSHDLRTPLNVLAGRLELARETGDEEHFDAADRVLDRVESLVEDLADVMREGNITGDRSDVDLDAIATSCWQTLDTKGATLHVDAVGTIKADEGALRRVFENLIRNAIEHGGADVTVRVGLSASGFYFEDDGPGVPEENRDDVFEPGFTTKEDGTGFGMASVHQIALAHGWEVTVADSTIGGARFEFSDVTVASGPS